MPYIEQTRRGRLLPNPEDTASTPGELNFQITQLILNYLNVQGISYTHFNDVLGALTAVQLEVYRRMVVKYEDQKAQQNGEVFPI